MEYITRTLNISTHQEDEMVNVYSSIETILKESGIISGEITLFVPHTTAAITINENADPDVKKDMLYGLSKAFPKEEAFQHFQGNSHAHIKSSVIGVNQTVLVEKNAMVLGTWQGIYFMEFDGPRTRKLIVRISGIK